MSDLLKAVRLERQRLAQNQQVPVEELRELVFTTYACSRITEGKACQLLCIDRLDFRQQWQQWAQENPRMQQIFDER